MRIAILDDYFDTLRGLSNFKKLADFEVTVWSDHVDPSTDLVKRLDRTDVLVLFRERTAITGEALDSLPNLRLISMRGDYSHVDVEACTRNRIVLSSNLAGGASSHSTAELTWGLILSSMHAITSRGLRIPDQVALVGNDDIELAAIIRPALTTVSLPVAEAGKRAISMLEDMMAGGSPSPPQILLDTELVIRETCGC